MIDPATGQLTFEQPAIRLGPAVKPADVESLLATVLTGHARGAAPWSLLGLNELTIAGERFAGTLCFLGERLEYVALTSMRPEFGVGFAELSEEKESARQRFHNEWLTKLLPSLLSSRTEGADAPAWTWLFPWGRIVSGWDVKNGTAEIVIRYCHESRSLRS